MINDRPNMLLSLIVIVCAAGAFAAPVAMAQAAPKAAPAATTSTLADLDGPARRIPQSFMGFSHEWPYVEELWDIPQYVDVIKRLQSYGSGPLVLRVGGGSTDKLVTVPEPHVWEALSKLYRATGMRFILGLNLFNNDIGLARRQMDAALKGLPEGSIISFEIGNEPDYYANKTSTHWNGTSMVASFNDYLTCCFHTEWQYMAEQLSCRNGPNSCVQGQFTGPVWGHLNLRNTTMDWFLRTNGRWVEMTSVHWYKATAEMNVTAAQLLEEEPIRKEMENLKVIVGVSNSYGKPLRVAEMNTISNSGGNGTSNVFASALWTLDASLEVAAAGAVGVNFHQGAGQNLYAAIIRWYSADGKLMPPQIRPSFYGMLMFQLAVRGGSSLLPTTTVSAEPGGAWRWVKVWALRDDTSGELRWVVINKDPSRAATAVLRADRSASDYAANASVLRLVAASSDPLTASSGISLGNVTYGLAAAPSGQQRTETLKTGSNPAGELKFAVYMPPGSAALVSLPRRG